MLDEAGLEDEVKKLNTMPLHLGAVVLSNSERIMNNFLFHAFNGFYTNDVLLYWYQLTEKTCIEKKPGINYKN